MWLFYVFERTHDTGIIPSVHVLCKKKTALLSEIQGLPSSVSDIKTIVYAVYLRFFKLLYYFLRDKMIVIILYNIYLQISKQYDT